MIEDLLSMCRDLLCYVMTSKDLEEDERGYIVSVVRRVVIVLFIKLRLG